MVQKRYQVRFTKAALRDLSKAVSRYNSMLTRYQKTGGKTIAKRADVSEIKSSVKNTAELREYIKRLTDYRKVSDFKTEQLPGYRFKTTRGERRSLNRLDTAARRRYNKEIGQLKKSIVTASSEEIINDILPKIAELEARPVVVSNIKNRQSFAKILTRYEKERLRPELIETGITLSHYLAAFSAVGLENVTGGREVFHKLSNFSDREFAVWMAENDSIDIDFIYDFGIAPRAKVNQISARLGMDIDNLL